MNTPWFVIINPTAGNGRAEKKWPIIKRELISQNILFKYRISKHKTHVISLVQKALNSGIKKIVSVGGDGTLHQVVNAIMTWDAKKSREIKIAVIPIGTGNDWVKTYGIPKNIKRAVQLINLEHSIQQDIGKICFSKKTIYFNNLAGIGFDGYVVNKIQQYKRLGAFSYIIAAIISLLFYKKITLKAVFDNQLINKPSLTLLIGLCKFSGGGMQLTKDVHPSDGFFDISYIENVTFLELLMNLRNLFNGKLAHHHLVKSFKTSYLKVETMNKTRIFVQADGELLPSENFQVYLLPNALNFVISEKS